MENIIFFSKNIKFSPEERFIVAAGVFDGVHLGHRKIIDTAVKRAMASGAKVAAVSFSPHPRALLCPDSPPKLLVSEAERVRLLHEAGADICGFINFTAETAALPPEEFLARLRDNGIFRTAGICVGSQWRFGAGGRGDQAVLDKFCRDNNWSFDAVEELTYQEETISSSAIRSAIAGGDLDYAAAMLGRKIQLSGQVVQGFQIAGSKLAAPTANLEIAAGVLPPDGVYSGSAEVNGKNFPAALNIGLAPTFGNDIRRIEVHLIGFDGSLYGRELTVSLHRFLRSERKFDSLLELKEQISRDIETIKQDHHLQNR